jgi:hypothetical protein
MTAIATALRSLWTRLAERDAASAMAGLGPDQRKEAGLVQEARTQF